MATGKPSGLLKNFCSYPEMFSFGNLAQYEVTRVKMAGSVKTESTVVVLDDVQVTVSDDDEVCFA